jgi:hypothetical protein
MAAIHAQHVFHCDLKLTTILVEPLKRSSDDDRNNLINVVYKIADVGSAAQAGDATRAWAEGLQLGTCP